MPSGLAETNPADFLAAPAELPLLPAETARTWGKTLVVAPHPDDESLGCGGAIALLSGFGIPVHVLFISDGTGSHPNSRKFPPPALRALRENEAQSALAALGVPPSKLTFLRLSDGAVPTADAPGFEDAATLCLDCLESLAPQTVLLPWRRDPHPDHRATSQIIQSALRGLSSNPRVLEYPVWAWERAESGDVPQPHEVRAFRLDIESVRARKQAAVAAHVSQVTHLIDDDPHGFWLSPEVLAHFERPWETYLETLAW